MRKAPRPSRAIAVARVQEAQTRSFRNVVTLSAALSLSLALLAFLAA